MRPPGSMASRRTASHQFTTLEARECLPWTDTPKSMSLKVLEPGPPLSKLFLTIMIWRRLRSYLWLMPTLGLNFLTPMNSCLTSRWTGIWSMRSLRKIRIALRVDLRCYIITQMVATRTQWGCRWCTSRLMSIEIIITLSLTPMEN